MKLDTMPVQLDPTDGDNVFSGCSAAQVQTCTKMTSKQEVTSKSQTIKSTSHHTSSSQMISTNQGETQQSISNGMAVSQQSQQMSSSSSQQIISSSSQQFQQTSNSSSMVTNGSGLVNNEEPLESGADGIVVHRKQTRSRHLSTSGQDDIASAYFASQYPQQQQVQMRQKQSGGSKKDSRRNSGAICSDNYILKSMATAAALIANGKKVSPERNTQTLQKSNEHVVEQKLLQYQKEQECQQEQYQKMQEEDYQQKQKSQQEIYQLQQQQAEQQAEQQEQQRLFIEQQHQRDQQIKQQQEQAMMEKQAYFQQQQLQQQQQQQQLQQQINQQQQQQSSYQQQAQMQQNGTNNHSTSSAKNSKTASRRNSFSYLTLLPEDGSLPHRTHPIGDPQTRRKSASTAATPDRDISKKWSVSASTEYLNNTGKGTFMMRSNPIGLAEPSVKRDGYAVGKDGSMYRSTGNLNMAGGTGTSRTTSRAASENRDTGNWKERRSSVTSTTGVRSGGNLAEPSGKPPVQSFMPFGNGSNATQKRQFKISKTQKTSTSTSSQSSSQVIQNGIQEINNLTTAADQITETRQNKMRNKRDSGDTSQKSNAKGMAGLTNALEKLETNETSTASVCVPLPRKRSVSVPRKMTSEQTTVTLSRPGSTRTSRQCSVEPETRGRLRSRQSSVEIFDAEYNLTIPNKRSRANSQSRLEEIHTEHIIMKADTDDEQQNHTQVVAIKPEKTGGEQIGKDQPGFTSMSVSVTNGGQQQVTECVSLQQNQIQENIQQKAEQQTQNLIQQQNVPQQQSMIKQQNSIQQQSKTITQSISSSQQVSLTEQTSETRRSRHTSGQNDTVLQGKRFNISNGLKRNSQHASQENLMKSNNASTEQSNRSIGHALKGLDTALEKVAKQQKQQETEYVAKVSSKTTSRRGSVSITNDDSDVTQVIVSLPASRNGSRVTSRRNSVSLGNNRRSRRNSLDVYTAEYAVQVGNKSEGGKIKKMEKKTDYHIKVDNEAESGLKLCGRCHLPTHKTEECTEFTDNYCPRCLSWEHWEDSCWTTDSPIEVCSVCNYEGHTDQVHDTKKYTQRRAIVDALGWEPFENWFYDQDFRGWWQVIGCSGVPLYRIYPRKTPWTTEKPKRDEQEDEGKLKVMRDDSVDDMIARVLGKRNARKIPEPTEDENISSGRSTPAHLKDIVVNLPNDEDEQKETSCVDKKSRTFSETLKMLDDDILAELDMK